MCHLGDTNSHILKGFVLRESMINLGRLSVSNIFFLGCTGNADEHVMPVFKNIVNIHISGIFYVFVI